MDQDEAGDGEGSKEWLVSALGQDHDVLLRQAEAAEARDGSWVLLVNSEPVLSLKAFINSDHHPFTIGETDALLCRQDDSCKLYIGGEFVPGQAVAEPGGDTREIPSSDQDRPPRYVIREHGERGSRERQETMVRQGMSRVRIMLALVSAAVAASVMTAIGLTNEFTVPHAILIWFFWGFAAVMGILGVYTMTTVEASLGVFFRLFGSPKVSGIWTVFLGMFYLGLSILFFWVPFFAE